MIITIASGKGGTGKTTVAVNLALSAAVAEDGVCLYDCDVEAPNARFFIDPGPGLDQEVTTPVPEVDEDLCTGCGLCQEVCEYNAIVAIRKKKEGN